MRACVAIMVVSASMVAAQAQAQAQTPAQTTSVTGQGAVRVPPDSASLTLSVRRTGTSQRAARASVNTRTLRVIRGLTRLGIADTDVQTSAVTLRQVRRRGKVTYNAAGLIGVVTQKLGIVGRVFDVATAAGATGFSGPQFSLEDDTQARAEATRVAARDARSRAEAATSELGLQITGVQSIALDSFVVAPAAPQAPAAEGRPPTPTPVRPGRIRVSATVRVVFMLAAAP